MEVGMDCNLLVLPTHSSPVKGAQIKALVNSGNLSALVGARGGALWIP